MALEDVAQEHEAKVWEMNNRPREVITFKPGELGYGPDECERCGDDMHPVRRGYGFNLCTPCATIAEKKRAGF